MEALANPEAAAAVASPAASAPSSDAELLPVAPSLLRRPHIAALPTLWPWQVVPPLGPGARHEPLFPLGRPGLELTYLGRNAIYRAARRLGLGGHEVIVPAYHHGVEVAALLEAGVRPRYARVDSSLQLDLGHVEAQIGPDTRAIYVIHYLGFPQPLAELDEICRRRGLLLLEDCALAALSKDEQTPLGSTGQASFFCFYKTLPVPHGGALLLSHEAEARAKGRAQPPPPMRPPDRWATAKNVVGSLLLSGELRLGSPGALLRDALRAVLARPRRRGRAQEVPIGTSSLDTAVLDLGMSGLCAAILAAIDPEPVVARRRKNWLELHAALADRSTPVFGRLPDGVAPLFYPLRVSDKDAALAVLRAQGIEAIDFWRSGHPSLPRGQFPDTDALRDQIIEIPCHQDLGEPEMAYLAEAAKKALGQR